MWGLRCDSACGLGPGPDATGGPPPGVIPAIIGPAWLTCGPPGTATPGCICWPIDTPGCIPWLEGWPCTMGWPPCTTPAGPIMPGCPANGCAILAIMFKNKTTLLDLTVESSKNHRPSDSVSGFAQSWVCDPAADVVPTRLQALMQTRAMAKSYS